MSPRLRLRPQGVLLLLCGAALLRIALFSELYLRYVKEGLRPYLIVSGAVLVVLGLVGLLTRSPATDGPAQDGPATDGSAMDGPAMLEPAPHEPAPREPGPREGGPHGHAPHAHAPHGHDPRGDGQDDKSAAHRDRRGGIPHGRGGGERHSRGGGEQHDRGDGVHHDRTEDRAPGPPHSHDHTRNPRVAWLLTAPALALLLFPPPALGSYSAEREEARVAARGAGTFPELPAGDPVDLTLGAFASRAEWDTGRSLAGRTIRLTGFVTGDDGVWSVARLLVTCCAADAQALKVEIRGADAPPPDTWVTVTGTWHPLGRPGSDTARPVLDAVTVRRTAAPPDPYEKR